MAVGSEVSTPPFADRATGNSNKNKNNVLSPFQTFRFERPVSLNSSATPLSGEKKRIGPLRRRNTTTTIARSELTQQSDVPCAADDINKAKQRLDASARDGDPWVLITCDDQGRITGLSNSCSNEFYRQVEQAFINDTSIADADFNCGLAITETYLPSRNRSVDLFSGRSSRRPSQLDEEGGFKRELSPMNRAGKRVASTLDDHSRSMTPGDTDQQCHVAPAGVIAVGAEDAVNHFYTLTFKAIQQQALKQILKAWIKELEPHKQKHHPYKGGVLPPYWPEDIPFVEPDHQRTEDRIAVAINIIQFVQRDPKWSYDGVDTLEASTRTIKLQFDDEPHEKRGKRQILLTQLYEVARQQGFWVKGEKDGDDPISYHDPMETMRVKRQPRAKRQKLTRTLSPPTPTSIGDSPDIAHSSQFTSPPSDATTVNATPLSDYCPTFTAQFHTEPEQSLTTNQHSGLQNNWTSSGYGHAGHINHSVPYGVPGIPQQTFPFTLPRCSSVTGQTSGPLMRSASFEPTSHGIEPMSFQYSNQTPSPSQLEFPTTSHGLPDMTITGIPITEVKMASQTATVYPVWTEEHRWDSTPAGYPPPQYHPPNDQSGHGF